MIDKLYELIMGENGFIVALRCENRFDESVYYQIVQILNKLTKKWKKEEMISKKAMLAVIELVEFLARSSDFIDDLDAIRVEDACFEVKDIINELYETV